MRYIDNMAKLWFDNIRMQPYFDEVFGSLHSVWDKGYFVDCELRSISSGSTSLHWEKM